MKLAKEGQDTKYFARLVRAERGMIARGAMKICGSTAARRMEVADLTSAVIAGSTPLQLAGRLGLALALALFIGLAFEEIYKREDRSSPPAASCSFPMLDHGGSDALPRRSPQYARLRVRRNGLFVLGLWMQAYLREARRRPNATSLMIPGSALAWLTSSGRLR